MIAPEFDDPYSKNRVDLLWTTLRDQTDSRIEPIAVGALGTTWRQWREDDASVIIEMARRERQEIPLPVAL